MHYFLHNISYQQFFLLPLKFLRCSLIKITDYLNVSIPYLLGVSDEENFFKFDSPTTFHIRLKELTEENDTKFSAVSNKMPFAKSSIYEWMRTGALPSLEYLHALADYFKVSIDFLLDRTDERNLVKTTRKTGGLHKP